MFSNESGALFLREPVAACDLTVGKSGIQSLLTMTGRNSVFAQTFFTGKI